MPGGVDLGSAFGRIEMDTSSIDRMVENAERGFARVQSSMQQAGQRLAGTGANLSLKLTAPLMAIGGASAYAAIRFESAFAGVRKTVDAGEAEFGTLRDSILDMASSMDNATAALPDAQHELAGIMELAGQLGVSGTENLENFTETIAKLTMATNLTADAAATELARFANITQMSMSNIDELGSVVVALGNNMATTEAEIVTMAQRLAGAGNQVGLTEADIMGLSAALSSVGIEAAAGGTAMSRVMFELDQAVRSHGAGVIDNTGRIATAQGDLVLLQDELVKAQETLANATTDAERIKAERVVEGTQAQIGAIQEQIGWMEQSNGMMADTGYLERYAEIAGVAAADFAAAWEADPAEAMASFVEGLGQMQENGEDVVAVLEELGMDDIRVRDALLRMAGAGDLMAEALGISAEAWDENVALQNEAEQRMATTEAQINLLKNTLTGLRIVIGDAILPVINEALGVVTPFIRRLADWIKQITQAHPQAAKLAAAVGALAAALGPALVIVGKLLTTLSGFNPLIYPVVAAVGALAFAFENNFMGIRDAVEDVVNTLAPLVAFFDDIWDAIFSGEGFKALPTVDIFAALKDSLGFERATEIFAALQGFVDRFAGIVRTIKEAVGGAVADLQAGVPLKDVLLNRFGIDVTPLETAWNALRNLWDVTVKPLLDTVIGAIETFIGDLLEGETLGEALADAFGIDVTPLENFASGLHGAWDEHVRPALEDLTGRIGGFVQELANPPRDLVVGEGGQLQMVTRQVNLVDLIDRWFDIDLAGVERFVEGLKVTIEDAARPLLDFLGNLGGFTGDLVGGVIAPETTIAIGPGGQLVSTRKTVSLVALVDRHFGIDISGVAGFVEGLAQKIEDGLAGLLDFLGNLGAFVGDLVGGVIAPETTVMVGPGGQLISTKKTVSLVALADRHFGIDISGVAGFVEGLAQTIEDGLAGLLDFLGNLGAFVGDLVGGVIAPATTIALGPGGQLVSTKKTVSLVALVDRHFGIDISGIAGFVERAKRTVEGALQPLADFLGNLGAFVGDLVGGAVSGPTTQIQLGEGGQLIGVEVGGASLADLILEHFDLDVSGVFEAVETAVGSVIDYLEISFGNIKDFFTTLEGMDGTQLRDVGIGLAVVFGAFNIGNLASIAANLGKMSLKFSLFAAELFVFISLADDVVTALGKLVEGDFEGALLALGGGLVDLAQDILDLLGIDVDVGESLKSWEGIIQNFITIIERLFEDFKLTLQNAFLDVLKAVNVAGAFDGPIADLEAEINRTMLERQPGFAAGRQMADNLVAGFGEDASSAAVGEEIGAALEGLDQAFAEHGEAGAIAYYETLAGTDPPESAVARLSERLGALVGGTSLGAEDYLDTTQIEGLDQDAFLEYFGLTPEGMDDAQLHESLMDTAFYVARAYGDELIAAAQAHDDAALQEAMGKMAADPLINAAANNADTTAGEVIGFIMTGLTAEYMNVGYDTFDTIAAAMDEDLLAALDANSPAQRFVPAGESIIDGIILGIENKIAALVAQVTAAAQAALDAANETLGIASPSRAFARIGEQMSAGLVEGLAGGSTAVQAALVHMLDPTLPPMPGPGGWGSSVDNSSHTTNTWHFSPQYAERVEDPYQDFVFAMMAAGVKR